MAQSNEQLKQAIAQAQSLSDNASELLFRSELAQRYIDAGQHQDAINELSLVVRLAHEAGDKLLVARTMLLVGKEYGALNNQARAVESFDYALTIGQMFADNDIIDVARSQKMIYGRQQSLNATRKSGSLLPPSAELTPVSPPEESQFSAKGRVIERELPSAPLQPELSPAEIKPIQSLEKATSFAAQIEAARAAYAAGRVSEARQSFQQILEASRTQEDFLAQSQVLYYLGVINANLRYFGQALQLLQDAVALTVKTKDYELRSAIFDIVISIFEKQGDAEGIQNMLKSKLDLASKTGTKADEFAIIMQMAAAHRDSGNVNDALYKYEDALVLAEEYGLTAECIDAMLNSGDVYIAANFAQLSVQRFRDALEAARVSHDRLREVQSLIKLAKAYAHTQDWNLGIDSADEAIKIARALKVNRLEGLAGFWLSRLYKGSGDAVTAARADKKARDLLGDEYQIVDG